MCATEKGVGEYRRRLPNEPQDEGPTSPPSRAYRIPPFYPQIRVLQRFTWNHGRIITSFSNCD